MRKKAVGRRPAKRAPPKPDAGDGSLLTAEWPFPAAAALGSAVRIQGIEREIRVRLPWLVRNGLTVENGRVVLALRRNDEAEFESASAIVAGVVAGIETLPVLPREAEDILTITAHERQKWLKDGRLESTGTRTVKLRGRAKAVTFHVFDPRVIEDALDRDLPALWRDEDARTIAENRRRASAKAALTRAGKGSTKAARVKSAAGETAAARPRLEGWDAFAGEGLLR